MNFMHEIGPCTAHLGQRRADGSIDLEHYETLARRERTLAIRAFWNALRQRFAPTSGGTESTRTGSPARLNRQGYGVREA
jgi:hypothetical protein